MSIFTRGKERLSSLFRRSAEPDTVKLLVVRHYDGSCDLIHADHPLTQFFDRPGDEGNVAYVEVPREATREEGKLIGGGVRFSTGKGGYQLKAEWVPAEQIKDKS